MIGHFSEEHMNALSINTISGTVFVEDTDGDYTHNTSYINKLINRDANWLFSYFGEFRIMKASHCGSAMGATSENRCDKNGNPHLILTGLNSRTDFPDGDRYHVRYCSNLRYNNKKAELVFGMSLTRNYDNIKNADYVIYVISNKRVLVDNKKLFSALESERSKKAVEMYTSVDAKKNQWSCALLTESTLREHGAIIDVASLGSARYNCSKRENPNSQETLRTYAKTSDAMKEFKAFKIGLSEPSRAYYIELDVTNKDVHANRGIILADFAKKYNMTEDAVEHKVRRLTSRAKTTLKSGGKGRQKISLINDRYVLLKHIFSSEELREYVTIEFGKPKEDIVTEPTIVDDVGIARKQSGVVEQPQQAKLVEVTPQSQPSEHTVPVIPARESVSVEPVEPSKPVDEPADTSYMSSLPVIDMELDKVKHARTFDYFLEVFKAPPDLCVLMGAVLLRYERKDPEHPDYGYYRFMWKFMPPLIGRGHKWDWSSEFVSIDDKYIKEEYDSFLENRKPFSEIKEQYFAVVQDLAKDGLMVLPRSVLEEAALDDPEDNPYALYDPYAVYAALDEEPLHDESDEELDPSAPQEELSKQEEPAAYNR